MDAALSASPFWSAWNPFSSVSGGEVCALAIAAPPRMRIATRTRRPMDMRSKRAKRVPAVVTACERNKARRLEERDGITYVSVDASRKSIADDGLQSDFREASTET